MSKKSIFHELAQYEALLAIARKNVPDVTFKQADMVKLNLGKKFDVILCLFSSIGYVKTYPNLTKTIKNFAQHRGFQKLFIRPGCLS